jgi:hypothetical protein
LSDHLAGPISILGVLFALAMLLADRSSSRTSSLQRAMHGFTEWLEGFSAPERARTRIVALTLVSVTGLSGFIFLAAWTPKLQLEELDGLAVKTVHFDFLQRISEAKVFIDYSTRGRTRCRHFDDRFVCRDQQGTLDEDKYVASSPAEILNYRMIRCIRARPEENARLVIDYLGVPAGDAIVGYYLIEHAGRLMRLTRPVNFDILVDGKPAYRGATTIDSTLHWFRAPVVTDKKTVNVGFIVSSPNVTKRFFCFYAQMADVTQNKSPVKAPPVVAPVRSQADLDDAP